MEQRTFHLEFLLDRKVSLAPEPHILALQGYTLSHRPLAQSRNESQERLVWSPVDGDHGVRRGGTLTSWLQASYLRLCFCFTELFLLDCSFLLTKLMIPFLHLEFSWVQEAPHYLQLSGFITWIGVALPCGHSKVLAHFSHLDIEENSISMPSLCHVTPSFQVSSTDTQSLPDTPALVPGASRASLKGLNLVSLQTTAPK